MAYILLVGLFPQRPLRRRELEKSSIAGRSYRFNDLLRILLEILDLLGTVQGSIGVFPMTECVKRLCTQLMGVRTSSIPVQCSPA